MRALDQHVLSVNASDVPTDLLIENVFPLYSDWEHCISPHPLHSFSASKEMCTRSHSPLLEGPSFMLPSKLKLWHWSCSHWKCLFLKSPKTSSQGCLLFCFLSCYLKQVPLQWNDVMSRKEKLHHFVSLIQVLGMVWRSVVGTEWRLVAKHHNLASRIPMCSAGVCTLLPFELH